MVTEGRTIPWHMSDIPVFLLGIAVLSKVIGRKYIFVNYAYISSHMKNDYG